MEKPVKQYKKVMVACATYNQQKKYLKAYIQNLNSQTYKNFEIVFCDNSNDNGEYAETLSEYGKVLRSPPDKIIHIALEKAYNKLRDYFLEHDFDYMWIVESDQLPPVNALEELIKENKDIVGCPYFLNRQNDVVCVHNVLTTEIYNYNELLLHAGNKKCVLVWGCGHGAVLATRQVIKAIKFRVDEKYSASPDTWWYEDIKGKFLVYCRVDLLSEHLRLLNDFDEELILIEEDIWVKAKNDFFNSGTRHKFFVDNREFKKLPRYIDKITFDALGNLLIVKK